MLSIVCFTGRNGGHGIGREGRPRTFTQSVTDGCFFSCFYSVSQLILQHLQQAGVTLAFYVPTSGYFSFLCPKQLLL